MTKAEAVQQARWVSCPKCSRRARAGQPFCELCGERLHDAAVAEPSPRRSLRCEGCGAAVAVSAEERTALCAFCGAPYVASGEIDPGRFAPEFVLPFAVGKRDAENAFKAWLGRSGWFVPGDLAHRGAVSSLRGVYIPFWSFSMRSQSTWDARIGEHWWETITESYTTTENGKRVTRTRTRRVQHTEWYPLSGRYQERHFHYLVSASKGLPQTFADAIRPFPLGEVTRYAPHFLSGWLAEEYSVGRDDAASVSEREFRARERSGIASFLPGDCHDTLDVETSFHDVTEDLIFLPIWILAYSYGGRTFRYVQNGATRKTHGEKPVSWLRVALLVAVIAAVIAVVILIVASLSGG